MKKILFKGLGPNRTVAHEERVLRDGAVVEVEDSIAEAYINAKYAIEINSTEQEQKEQKHIAKRNETRKDVEDLAKKKKEGDK